MNIKRFSLFLLVSVLETMLAWSNAITLGDYYIVHDFTNNVLTNVDGSPKLQSYSSSSDASYLFTAESASGDYVKLRHKATGKYLTASTSNEYSVLLSDAGSGDQYYWKLESVQRFSTVIISKRNTNRRLGCDFGDTNIYYDKTVGGLNWFTIIPSNGSGFEASRKATKTSTTFTNEYNVTEKDVYCVTEDITVTNSGSNYVDLHIISGTPFDGGTVNLSNEKCWLVFEKVRPSSAKSKLANVKINGVQAVAGTNCRVEIYLQGSVVIPTPNSSPFVAQKSDGGQFSLNLGNNTDLKENNNSAVSFTLKRGYMATVASGKNGKGYSQVWVADHKDLTVTLPQALKNRVSSVYIRNWHYAGKSGYAKSGDYRGESKNVGATWFWNWDASLTSSEDIEYIPIKAHLYWPDNGQFWKSGSTAMMLFNEPEHSEQHTSSKCTCGGTISEWAAYQNTTQFNSCGLRIGSPSATDLSWTKTYLDDCWNMAQRCDFTCVHAYWVNESSNKQWDNNLATLKTYGRQVWITEWKYGASWVTSYTPSSCDEYAKKVLSILDKLEYNDYVERYAYYPHDIGGTNGWMTSVFWDSDPNKGVNPTGHIYKNVKQHLGYKASLQPTLNWWAPAMNAPTMDAGVYMQDGKYVLTVNNNYGDNTQLLSIMKKTVDGNWTLASTADPSEYDDTKLTVAVDTSLLGTSFTVKAVITSLHGSETRESNEVTFHNLADLQNMTFDSGTFVSDGVVTYAKDKATGRNLSGMQPVDGWTITENGDARASGQYQWGSQYVLGGTGYLAPTRNSDGTSSGGGLGIVAVWTNTATYTQNIVLDEGKYELTIPVCNSVGGTSAISKNLIGFIECGDGTEHLATTTTYPVGSWTTEKITWKCDKPITGYLSLGYQATNAGSASMPHLFVDYVKLRRFIRGDIDGNGVITVADMTLLIKHLINNTQSTLDEYVADVNADGTVDIQDVGAIAQKMLK